MEDFKSIPTFHVNGNIRSAYLDAWREDVVFNLDDVDDGLVIAQGQRSGAQYLLELDDFGYIAHAEIMY